MNEKSIKLEYEKMCGRLRDLYALYALSLSPTERDIKILEDYRKTVFSVLQRTVYSLSLNDVDMLEKSSEWITHYFEHKPLYITKNKIVKIDIFNKRVTYKIIPTAK